MNCEPVNWEPPSKESHPGKSLSRHIEETRDLFGRLLDFYDIRNTKTLEVVSEIIKYHDHGKLHPEWNFNSGLTHSNYSAKYYFEEVIKKMEVNPKIALILLLILRHHGSLKREVGFKEYRSLEEFIKREWDVLHSEEWKAKNWGNWFCKNFPFEERIKLADLYGLFKISDCLSAADYINYSPVCPTVKDVREFLPDEKRRREQDILREIGSMGFLNAPTGWGKTKASPLYFMEKNIKKAFLLLPTITAINKLYDDFRKIYGDNVGKYFYFYDVEIYAKRESYEIDEYEYFLNQHFLKSVVITSIDQFLLSFLQVGSYHMKRYAFRNAAIIIDEIHLLNPRMLCILLHFLKNFREVYNFQILFMSATFSKALKNVIKNELPGIKIDDVDFYERNDEYKKLRRIGIILRLENELEELIPDIIEKVKRDKRVLVIVNTVEYAVRIKKKLDETRENRAILLHARFTYYSRDAKEKEIEKLKKTPHILISTQVCEVSLDISYDYLYTEVAPLPSLIQRFGRVRRGLKEIAEKPNVFITKPHIENDRYYPYEKDDLKNAKCCLEEIVELRSEYQLLQKFEELESKKRFEDYLGKVKRDLRLETTFENWNRTGYFFSLDLSEDDVRNLLSYRESFTTLVIPSDEVIIGDERAIEMRAELERGWNKFIKAKKEHNIKEIRNTLTELKGYAVNVPIYWVKRNGVKLREQTGIPIVERMHDHLYHIDYGFITSKNVDVII